MRVVLAREQPEDGVDRYEYDRTQGPACAIACGAGTIYRNYFVPIDGDIGQTAHRQLNGLADLAAAARANDEIFVLLIGHCSFDGKTAAFNLPGPDLTADDYAKLLQRFPTQKIVFDGAGSSEVQLDAATFGGQIEGMAATDQLDLRTIGYGLSTTGTYVGDASGGVEAVHIYSNVVTVDLAPGASREGMAAIVHELFVHYDHDEPAPAASEDAENVTDASE